MSRIFRGSLCRIAELDPLEWAPLPRSEWAWGDYVLTEIEGVPDARARIELETGRHAEPMVGDRLLGALGTRYATLEATGSWELIGADGRMTAMTSAGLLGVIDSVSPALLRPLELRYLGHAVSGGVKRTMGDFVPTPPEPAFDTPVVLIVGSSMSAGKTASARAIVRRLKDMDKRVVACKLTGAARYRDALTMRDAGADRIYDFVDAGLPSTVCPPELFRERISGLLRRIQADAPDVVVVEAGASPLEPYNGEAITELLAPYVCYTVLAASDPYAVLGIEEAFGFHPDLVTGITTNTLAGIQLVERLCRVRALSLIDPKAQEPLRLALQAALDT